MARTKQNPRRSTGGKGTYISHLLLLIIATAPFFAKQTKGNKWEVLPQNAQPGMPTVRDSKRYKNHKKQIPKLSFMRLVKEVAIDIRPDSSLRFQPNAFCALQEAAEAFIVGVFQDAAACAEHAKV